MLFLALSFFLNIEAQTSLDSISFYYQKGDYKKSISFAEELKKQYLNGKDTLNFNYAYLLSSLGTLNKSIGNNKKSEKYYIQSIAILEKYNEKDEMEKPHFLAQDPDHGSGHRGILSGICLYIQR